MRAALGLSACISVVLALAFPTAASAQTQNQVIYRDNAYWFQAIFPEQPMARDISYSTKDGVDVPARQFYVERGTNLYHVNVVNLPDGPAVDADAVEHAAEQMRGLGEVRVQFEVAYDPGIPGWQMNVTHRDGRQVRSTIYMWDHNLYVVEAITAPGDTAALMLDQSIILLNADGTDVDTGSGNEPADGRE